MTEKEGKIKHDEWDGQSREGTWKSQFIIALNNHVLSKTRRIRSESGKHP